MKVEYVGEAGADLVTDSGKYELLWGDPCHIIHKPAGQAEAEVWARGRKGKVDKKALIPDPRLLEIYVIDVGQGDGVLIKTPNGKWHLVDGGRPAREQMTLKSAAHFVRWKFLKDLRKRKIKLETIVLSHPDLDHFGGLIDVMSGSLPKPGTSDTWDFEVEVERFFHCGMGRFAVSDPLGKRVKGATASFPFGQHGFKKKGTFIVELLDGKGDFRTPGRPFTDDFTGLAEQVGKVPGLVRRLDRDHGHLPGYGPGESSVEIHVLGPILETLDNGKRGLRRLGGDSITRNGHSVVLRIDHGNARVLLTGDLNTKSQKLLRGHVPEREFAADVAKGCHHGADDVDLGFVAAVGARATVISSGDNEDYSHPRPRILGASGLYGREAVDLDGKRMPPLIYSTELARSVRLDYVERSRRFQAAHQYEKLKTRHVDVSDDKSGSDWRNLSRTPVSFDLVYGLINVRTDGRKILLASLEEKGHDFDKRWMQAGVSPS